MDILKQMVTDHKAEFEEVNLPEGDQIRFLKKMYGKPMWRRYALPIAAVLVLLLGVTFYLQDFSTQFKMRRIITNYNKEIASLTNNMMLTSSDEENVITIVDNITFEAIPFLNQLPEEMSDREKCKALKEYYSQKLEGVHQLKTYLSQSLVENE